MNEPVTVQIVSDFVCPWCFVGKRRLEKALATRPDCAVKIDWLPFQLSPDMPREGKLRRQHYAEIFGEDRAELIMANMRDTGVDEGIAFSASQTAMSPNTLLAHSLVFRSSADPAIDINDLTERLFVAHHEQSLDLGNPEVLADIAAEAGINRRDVLADLVAGTYGPAVEQLLEQVRASQVSGVPFFVLNGRLALSGAQPVEVLLQAFDQALEGSPAESGTPG